MSKRHLWTLVSGVAFLIMFLLVVLTNVGGLAIRVVCFLFAAAWLLVLALELRNRARGRGAATATAAKGFSGGG